EGFARDVRAGKAKPTAKAIAALERPIYDYKMVDGEYLLPLVVDAFLARADAKAVRSTFSPARIDALARVAVRIDEQTRGFAARGRADRLVALKRGEPTGNWRDSLIGLGHGRIPLDVNA